MATLNYEIKKFEDLDVHELYEVMQLRQDVFVVEQDCPYLDADDKDQASRHLMGRKDGKLVAYARIIPKGMSYEDYASIGRVIVARSVRRLGLGTEVLEHSIRAAKKYFPGEQIKISAQTYALSLYENVGFRKTGNEYLEDDIPHFAMIYEG